MERWAAGWYPLRPGARLGVDRAGARPGVALVPRGAQRPVSRCDGLLWACGYEPWQVRSVGSRGHARLTAIGSCWATDEELVAVLEAARSGVASRVSVSYGAYLTVIHGRGGRDPGARGRETIVFGDPAGLTRVFYVEIGGGVLWATAALPLGALVGARPQPNVLALAIAVDGTAPWGGEVPLDKVRVVPPRWLLRIGAHGPAIERWHFPGPPVTFAEAADRFGPVLTEGVRRRCHRYRQVGTALAGTDSSTLTVLAALSAESRPGPAHSVIAVTHVGDAAEVDIETARSVAESYPDQIHHVELGLSESALRYRGLDQPRSLPHTDLPSALTGVWSARADMLAAAELGAACYLAGYGGDNVLSAPSSALADLVRRGSFSQVLREAARSSGRSRSPLLATAVAAMALRGTSYEQSLRQAAHAIRVGADVATTRRFRWVTPTAAAAWLTDAAAGWTADRLDQLAFEGCPDDDPVAACEWYALDDDTQRAAGLRSLAGELGMELELPYYDAPVLALWADLPWALREPTGTFKPLVTQGVAGVLPAAITSRTRKDHLGVENADARGMTRHIHALWQIVDHSTLIEGGALERSVVVEYCEDVFARVETGVSPMLRFLSAEIWLATVEEKLALSKWWEPAPEEIK